MQHRIKKHLIIGLVITLLAALGAFPAMAATPAPALADNISGDPDAGSITGPSGNSWVNYDAGTCFGKCRVNTHLPGDASGNIEQVPHPKVSSLQVQVEGDGSYSVCFSTKGVDYPQVWQYVDGQWVFLSHTEVDGQICVRGHGSGVFALFGYTSPETQRFSRPL